MKAACLVLLVWTGASADAQMPTAQMPSMRQLMLDLIHPASNDILLLVNRGEPKDEAGWATVRRSALTLAESGNLLTLPGRMPKDRGPWEKYAQGLSEVGSAAYKAAQAKDLSALAALTAALDASCTNCHKQYRPNVFPGERGSK